jgi:hypothetical protein
VLLQIAEQVVCLLAAQIGVLDHGRECPRRQEPVLAPLRDRRLNLLDVNH